MTFPIVNPLGWTDGVDAITAAQISQIDAHQSNAIDGTNGGSYAPSSALSIAASGIQVDRCINHNVRGNYELSSAQAGIRCRVDRVSIDPSSFTFFVIDTSSDIYIPSGPILALSTVVLSTTLFSYEPAVDGATIIVRKHVNTPGPQTDNAPIEFRNEDGGLLGGLRALTTVVAPMANPYLSVEFAFSWDLQKWVVLDADPQFLLL
jgi:hypothetical protein